MRLAVKGVRPVTRRFPWTLYWRLSVLSRALPMLRFRYHELILDTSGVSSIAMTRPRAARWIRFASRRHTHAHVFVSSTAPSELADSSEPCGSERVRSTSSMAHSAGSVRREASVEDHIPPTSRAPVPSCGLRELDGDPRREWPRSPPIPTFPLRWHRKSRKLDAVCQSERIPQFPRCRADAHIVCHLNA